MGLTRKTSETGCVGLLAKKETNQPIKLRTSTRAGDAGLPHTAARDAGPLLAEWGLGVGVSYLVGKGPLSQMCLELPGHDGNEK